MNGGGGGSARLLAAASSRLAAAGFETQPGTVEGNPWILAENEWFAVAVVSAETLQAALMVEPLAAAELVERLLRAGAGAKRWDAYVALLIPEPLDASNEDSRKMLDDLRYNTRGVRRLIATGVREAEDLDEALRPLLPLPNAADVGLPEAFDDLAAQLVVNGVDAEDAERYLAAFRQSGDLHDV